ncbi:MAG: hypothetical protein ACPGYY_02000 [Bacteroidia bacterium]
MNWNLSLAYSWWYILVCILVGGIYASLLYYRSKDNQVLSDYPLVKWVLPLSRFVLVSTLVFLLLGPVLRYVGFETEKPILALLIDDSRSISESDLNSEELKETLSRFTSSTSEKFEVSPILYSDVPGFSKLSSIGLQGKETNMSSPLRYVREQFVNQNLSGIVMLTDGIYNAGSDPRSIAKTSMVPIYTVGVGDTTVYPDLQVNNVSHNSIAYLGNEFPFRIEIKGSKLEGSRANLNVSLNNRVVLQRNIVISKEDYFEEIDVKAIADKVGQSKVVISLSTFDNERNKENNSFTFFVDVIDGKKKVEIWSNAPHPDLGMLKSLINVNDKYEADVFVSDYKFKDGLDLVVLHNWFSSSAEQKLFEKLKSAGVPTLLILGDKFNGRLFNSGSQDIKFETRGGSVNRALPLLNANFEYFEIDEELKSVIKKMPPLSVPFGSWSGYLPGDVMIYQQIGSVPTEEPLLLVSSNASNRLGVISGTGVWRWRLIDFEQSGSHDNMVQLVSQMVQFLAVTDDKQLLKVYPTARQYGKGEQVTLLGELYNQSLEAIEGQEINILLQAPDGKSYKHTMTNSGSQYKLILKNLQEGAYTYSAASTVGGELLKDVGSFNIIGLQKELLDLTANYGVLRSVSQNSGGQFFQYEDFESLSDQLMNDQSFNAVISEDTVLNDLINMKWLFWILTLLLALEWFIRKWAGGY